MAVDRGGLQYRISVRDDFSKATERFRSELASSKKAFRDFQRGLASQKGNARALKDTVEATRALSRAQREGASASRSRKKELTEEEKALKRLAQAAREQRAREQESVRIRNAQTRDRKRQVAEEKRLERERIRLEKERQASLDSTTKREKAASDARRRALAAEARAAQERERIAKRINTQAQKDLQARIAQTVRTKEENEKLAAAQLRAQRNEKRSAELLDPQIQAQKRLNRELFQRQVALKQIDGLRARARAQFASGDLIGGRDTVRRAKELERSIGGSAKQASSLLFSFRRLVGILAVFTLARRGVQAFQDLVGAGIQFNDQIISSEIAIAGLVSAVGDVRDEFGKSVDAVTELNLAQQLARQQIRLLRQDALRTTATFEQLLDTFQVAVAPGFAAGLNLDEIRQLTVDISQAATAIGLPQNQLAEEVRSLLSGTIQARTTRIATALGITNADIRRLRETGELFDFLEARFEAFAEASEKAARQTLNGIRTLVTGALRELLGQAAEPLFRELLDLGNQVFDRVLTIRDEAGNIVPNPQAVAAFRELFQILADGVVRVREFASSVGFSGLRNALASIGVALSTGLEFAIGFAQVLFATLNAVVGVVRSIAEQFNLTNRDLGKVAGLVGLALGVTVLWRQTFGLLRIDLASILKLIGKIPPQLFRVAGLALAIVEGFKLLFREITGLEEFNFGDTIKVIVLSFQEAFDLTLVNARIFAKKVANSITGFITDPIGTLAGQVADILGLVSGAAALIPGVSEETRQKIEDTATALDQFKNRKGGGFQLFSEEDLDKDRQRLQEISAEFQAEYEKLFKDVQKRGDEGDAFGDINDQLQKFIDSLQGKFTPVVSTAAQEIAKLAGEATKLVDELREADILFDAAAQAQVGGAAGRIQGVFTDRDVRNAEQLREIRRALVQSESTIANSVLLQVQGFELSKQQSAELQSALRDRTVLQDTLNEFERESLRLAITKAATIARTELPGLREEIRLSQLQAGAEAEIANALTRRVGPRQLEVIAARQAVRQAALESQIRAEQLQREIQIAELARDRAEDPSRRASLDAFVAALQQRLSIEEAIALAKQRQLEIELQQAELIENGTFTEGLREGLLQLSEELPTRFEAAVNIVRQSTDALASFISQSIVSAFDPTDDTDLTERFARFLQQLAGIILQQLINNAIAEGLQRIFQRQAEATVEVTAAQTAATIKLLAAKSAATIEIAAAKTAAAIRASSGAFNRGGLVKGFNRGGSVGSMLHQTARAVGLARGGPPPGISPKDTVPAWLTPGEFVIRKSAVDDLGLGFLQALNRGSLPIAEAGRAAGASVSNDGQVGMARGGLVADRIQSNAANAGENTVTVQPILVARDREASRIFGGGRNAYLRFARENAGVLNATTNTRRN